MVENRPLIWQLLSPGPHFSSPSYFCSSSRSLCQKKNVISSLIVNPFTFFPASSPHYLIIYSYTVLIIWQITEFLNWVELFHSTSIIHHHEWPFGVCFHWTTYKNRNSPVDVAVTIQPVCCKRANTDTIRICKGCLFIYIFVLQRFTGQFGWGYICAKSLGSHIMPQIIPLSSRF